jgi:hypothetical protein
LFRHRGQLIGGRKPGGRRPLGKTQATGREWPRQSANIPVLIRDSREGQCKFVASSRSLPLYS